MYIYVAVFASSNNTELNSNFMVSTKYVKDSKKLIKFITKKQYAIRSAFKPVVISIHSSMHWISFDLPAHRYPEVIKYIKTNFDENIDLRFRPLVLKKEKTEKQQEQLQIFNKSEDTINRLCKFLLKNNLCDFEPYTRYSPISKSYHMKWYIPENKNKQEIIDRIEGYNYNLRIKECNTAEYIANIKNNAAIALLQLFKHATSKFKSYKSKLEDAKSLLIKKLITTRAKFTPLPDAEFPETDIAELIQKYPPFQLYSPKTRPTVASVIKIKQLAIGFLNINGGAMKKINHNHPMLFQMISKRSLDLIAFIDTRITVRPNWILPGYELIGFKGPQSR